jgi:DNA-binding Xre family transcriptional regulator
MIQLRVKELLLQKGIKPTPYSLFKFGIPYSTSRQILEGKVKLIKLEHIERLCIALRCTPKEILGVYSTAMSPIPPDSPLFAWVGYELPFPLAQFRDLSPEQLCKASVFLRELIAGESAL